MLFSQSLWSLFRNPSSKPSKTHFQHFSLHFVLIILLFNILMASELHYSYSFYSFASQCLILLLKAQTLKHQIGARNRHRKMLAIGIPQTGTSSYDILAYYSTWVDIRNHTEMR